MPAMRIVAGAASLFALALMGVGCGSTPPKPSVPSLAPETAYTLLQNDAKAKNWLIYVQKQNASCRYELLLPDQSAHPDTIDLTHIVVCGGAPASKEYDASVSFAYDNQAQHWTVSRFSS